jgi:hypothetical protein
VCTSTFLDIQQAFDQVWHDGLLYKLKATFPTPYYLLLQSYLPDHYTQIKFNKETSANFPIHSGVPQGSFLGPLLYLLFMADIPTRHDTAIMASNENPQTASQSLQTHLNQLETWLSNWRVKVNASNIHKLENWLSSCNNKWNTTTSNKRSKIPRPNTRPKTNMETLTASVVWWLACWPLVPGFKPGRSRIFSVHEKILSMPSFGGEVKESVPCPSFAACKRT